MYTFFISGNLGFYKEKRHSWNQITFIFNIISNRQYSLCLYPGSFSLSVFPLPFNYYLRATWLGEFPPSSQFKESDWTCFLSELGRTVVWDFRAEFPCNPTAVTPGNARQSRTDVWLLVRSSGGRVPPLNTTRPDGYVLTVVLNSDYLCRGEGSGEWAGCSCRRDLFLFPVLPHNRRKIKKKNSFDQD